MSSSGSRHLADLSFPEVERRAAAGALLAVPLGSTEQHGAHLPLSTDTDIAVALCQQLAAARTDVVIAPAVSYGSSGEHAGFAGTLSIGQPALELLVLELGRSAGETFSHLLFVSAHGGNAEAATRAVRRLQLESRDVLLFMPRWPGDPHAGRPETSMLLELTPSRVAMDLAARGDTRPLSQTWSLLRSHGVRGVTESGVLGDPTGATAAEGRALLENLSSDLIAAVAAWRAEVPAS
jgi:mycofactocin precursor peptide peptidase